MQQQSNAGSSPVQTLSKAERRRAQQQQQGQQSQAGAPQTPPQADTSTPPAPPVQQTPPQQQTPGASTIDAERATIRASLERALRFPRVHPKTAKWIRNNVKAAYVYVNAGAPGAEGQPPSPPASITIARARVDMDAGDQTPVAMRGDALTGSDSLCGFTLSAEAVTRAYGVSVDQYRAILADAVRALGLKILSEAGESGAGDSSKALANGTRGVVGMLDAIQRNAFAADALPVVQGICGRYMVLCKGTPAPEVCLKLEAMGKRVKGGPAGSPAADSLTLYSAARTALTPPAPQAPAPAPTPDAAGVIA